MRSCTAPPVEFWKNHEIAESHCKQKIFVDIPVEYERIDLDVQVHLNSPARFRRRQFANRMIRSSRRAFR